MDDDGARAGSVLPGRLAERYTLGEVLGRRDGSVVHRGRDELLDRAAPS